MKTADHNLVGCIGCTAADTVQQIIHSIPGIAEVTISSYAHLPLVQKRIRASNSEREIIDRAMELRAAIQLPFWDCVMLSISASEEPMDALLDAAATHMSLRKSDVAFDRVAVLDGGIQHYLSQKSFGQRDYCLLSEVLMFDGSVQHLPMMDFHCAPSAAGRKAAVAVCKRIFPAGAILLESGESFHAYGLELLRASDLCEFLGRALLYSPIIDRAYIAHQLAEGRCALRVSGIAKPVPITVEII